MRQTLPDWLKQRLRSAPKSPGCYLMRARPVGSAPGEVVYVGKAKDLRARLSQYFAPNPGDSRFFVGLLDRVLGSIDTIVTKTTKEALILENDLIKEFQPRFNVKLKDDKNFLNIRIARDHSFPRLEVVRRQRRDGADYFGPYESATAIRNTLRVVNRHFRLRTCRDGEFRNRSRPCLEYQIGRCPAPCVLDVSPTAYADNVQDVRLFLQGRSTPLLKRLEDRMRQAAVGLEFELAAHYRDQIKAIERALVPQSVRLNRAEDIDTIGMAREADRVVVVMLQLRSGVVRGAHVFPMTSELDDVDVVDNFLVAYYGGERPLPDLVLVPRVLTDSDVWGTVLTEARGRRVEVRYPQRGDKRRLLEMANDNAQDALRTRKRNEDDALATLMQLQEALSLKNFPKRIECYDISNIQGAQPVGSMVVSVDGQLTKKEYRRYIVRSLDTPNDYEMMREVLSRRFRRGIEEGLLPDLVVVDGGKGQLNVASEVLQALQIVDVDLAALAKGRVLDASGHVKRASHSRPTSADVVRSSERVFRPNRPEPVVLKAHSSGLFLLQRLRDEAHRFAITLHQQRRAKRTLTSELDAVAGVGPARTRALLTHFGSLKAVKEATEEELAACPGISRGLASRIAAALGEP